MPQNGIHKKPIYCQKYYINSKSCAECHCFHINLCCSVLGGVRPKCSYARAVAQRPREVRSKNPICIKYGSDTSSIVSSSSCTLAAIVVIPTGPPENFVITVSKTFLSKESNPLWSISKSSKAF